MDPSHALDPSLDDAVGPRPAGRPHAPNPRIHTDFDPTVSEVQAAWETTNAG